MFLPNIDSGSISDMLQICRNYPGICYPMAGLHPTSVKENYLEELEIIRDFLDHEKFIAIGEIGIDLYWDKTFLKEQEEAFRIQLKWAKEKAFPVVIHARESFQEIFRIMDSEQDGSLTGVFHSFTGNQDEVKKIVDYGFYIGINGIVTFKNSGLDVVAREIPLDRLLIETDSPFLSPVPHRGKRNESSFVTFVAERIAEIHSVTKAEIAAVTTRNALNLFNRVD